jgi:hypothetical protein
VSIKNLGGNQLFQKEGVSLIEDIVKNVITVDNSLEMTVTFLLKQMQLKR